ncbi:Transposable element Tcb1 transposase [Frankliniella fusca]|uniref:Transposable element Tcb1 transposase n=1 Tax=Frankliniella fusca TaxID=407009 RepID=A0AAE1I3R7_9NEOP|nr:Transposable element Tcb1 transposase [Frankliniella fusca]
MFSDECRFALRKCDGRKKVSRRRGTRDQHFQGKTAFGGGSIMFWGGGMMFGRKMALVEIPHPGGLNQQRYIAEVLVPHVLGRNRAHLHPAAGQRDGTRRQSITKVRAMLPLPDNMDELRAAVLRAWDEVTVEEVNNLVISMPNRCRAVARARGGNTPY